MNYKNQILKWSTISCFTLCMLSAGKKEKHIYDSGNLVPKTVLEDPSIPSVTINGTKLHAQAFGPEDSTLIICLHGGPGANFRYLLNCKSLAEKGFRVVFYDQRGSGLSQRFPIEWYLEQGEDATEKAFNDDLNGIINHYKTNSNQKVILLGHSWGAMLATSFAGKYPTKINGLILGEPGGLKWDDIYQYVGNSRSFKLWSEALNDATYLDQFITGNENDHNILDYKMALISSSNTIIGDLKSELGANGNYYKSVRDGAVIGAAMFKIGKKYNVNFSTGISQFQPKVLFFYSSNNTAYPDSWAEKISLPYLNKEVVKVNGVGHSGMFDQINTWTNFTEPKVIEYINSL
jgi:proline iminopeptidase